MRSPVDERLLAALGFAMKAGKVRSGEFAAQKALKSGRAALAVIDKDCSEQTKKHWSQMCINAGVPLIEAEGPGRAIGKDSHMVACVLDNGFAEMILRCRQKNEL